MPNWLKALPAVEPVYAAMRVIRAKSDGYLSESAALSPRNGALAVGNAHNDAFCRGEALAVFLRELGRGYMPDMALETAKAEAREMIHISNQRCSYEIRRSDCSCDALLEDAWRKILAAAK